MDINCGVRLMTTNIMAEEINKDLLVRILQAIAKRVPQGVGKSSTVKELRKPNLEGLSQEVRSIT